MNEVGMMGPMHPMTMADTTMKTVICSFPFSFRSVTFAIVDHIWQLFFFICNSSMENQEMLFRFGLVQHTLVYTVSLCGCMRESGSLSSNMHVLFFSTFIFLVFKMNQWQSIFDLHVIFFTVSSLSFSLSYQNQWHFPTMRHFSNNNEPF